MTTRLGTRWDQEASSASPTSRGDDAPCEVPKYALTDPLGGNVVNGRVVDAGFSPEPYAAGVPLLLHAEDCSHLLGERTIPSRASSLSQLERFPPRLQRSHSLEWSGPAAPPRRMATSASLETLQVRRLWAHDELPQPQAETSLTRLRLGDLQREVNLSASQLAAAHAAAGRAKVPQVSKMPRSSSDAPLARVAAASSSSSLKISCSSIAASAGEWPRPGWLSPEISRSSSTLSIDTKLSLDLRSSASKLNLEAAVAAAAAARPPGVSVSPHPVVQSL